MLQSPGKTCALQKCHVKDSMLPSGRPTEMLGVKIQPLRKMMNDHPKATHFFIYFDLSMEHARDTKYLINILKKFPQGTSDPHVWHPEDHSQMTGGFSSFFLS